VKWLPLSSLIWKKPVIPHTALLELAASSCPLLCSLTCSGIFLRPPSLALALAPLLAFGVAVGSWPLAAGRWWLLARFWALATGWGPPSPPPCPHTPTHPARSKPLPCFGCSSACLGLGLHSAALRPSLRPRLQHPPPPQPTPLTGEMRH
jgi:hypothetical protein